MAVSLTVLAVVIICAVLLVGIVGMAVIVFFAVRDRKKDQ